MAVWLANTAGLLLPVSNLTNLLAVGRLGLPVTAYARTMALPSLTAVAVTVAVLAIWQRRALRGRYDVPQVLKPTDPVLFAGAALACLLLVPALTGLQATPGVVARAVGQQIGFAERYRRVNRGPTARGHLDGADDDVTRSAQW